MKGIDKRMLLDVEIKALKNKAVSGHDPSKCFNAKRCHGNAAHELTNGEGEKRLICNTPRCEHAANAELKIHMKSLRHAKRNRGAEPMRQSMAMQA